jgi:ComF family protein
MRCGTCLGERHAPFLDVCLAALDYAYPWDQLIARFKFRGEPALAQPLAALMLAQPQVISLLQEAHFLMPIPVSITRLAERGYNQAWELCKALTAQVGVTCATGLSDGLVRIGQAPDQHNLPADLRIKNVKGAFAVQPVHVPHLRGRHVLLVDDVSTTGATLRAAAIALRQAGVHQVSALVLARTASD